MAAHSGCDAQKRTHIHTEILLLSVTHVLTRTHTHTVHAQMDLHLALRT